ncbi:AMP-binding protein [Qipengyuania vesicularis]|uniref:AMP-binding protein n=1 Tax=Qipengyuania vesicularis TaxID=2867232 RepID=UPI001C867C2E|nr:AMP-binding protein [Qipengyuania vesicularis]MBX7528028.1 AMP-binding protein [Qipengyuania vesicularis]
MPDRIVSSAAGGSLALRDNTWIGADKVSGLEFLRLAQLAWDERAVLMIGKAPSAGIEPEEWHTPAPGGGWWDAGFTPDDAEALAQVSTTSGTTGEPKAIAISRRAVSDTVARLVEHMELDSSLREYVGVPVTFSFGLARTRAAGAVGGSVYLPENGFRPDEIARMLAAGEINALSAVPTMLRTLIANPELVASAGDKLRWLEIGSQYMSGEEKRAIRDLFPNAVILQHYGLTEASRSTFLRIDKVSDAELESVGRAVGDGEVRIDGEGHIAVRGSHLASGILRDGALQPLVGEDGWLTTSDLGEIRDGAVFYSGRSDDVANIGGIKVSAEHFERGVARRLGTPLFGAACVMEDSQRGQKLGVAILPAAPEIWREALAAEAAEAGLAMADLAAVELDELPRTGTGKVQRNVLAEIIAEQATARREIRADGPEEELSEEEERIAAIWRDVLNVPSVRRHDTFFDLGGDSLSAISVMLRMEQAGIPEGLSQQIFEGRSIAEIAAGTGEPGAVRPPSLQSISANAINFTRGILVLIVIGAHWGPFLWTKAGRAGEIFAEWSWPLFRFGTPGFAMVFGLGLGFFWSQTARDDPARLKQRIRISLLVVGLGFALIASIKALQVTLAGEALGPDWPDRFFYDVLLFYVLAVASLYPLLRLVVKSRQPVVAALVGMALAFLAFELLNPLADIDVHGFAKLAITMLTAGYGYPRMMGFVLAGLAAGLWIKAHSDDPRLGVTTALAGLALVLGGIVLSFLLGIEERWFIGPPSGAAIVSYVGAMLLLFAAAHGWQRRLGGHLNLAFRVTVLLGMLSLPAYVLHGAAFPMRELLGNAGLPTALGVGIPVFLVMGLLAIALRKAYLTYYGTRAARSA